MILFHIIYGVDIVKSEKRDRVVFNIINVYNRDNKSVEELKLLFNEKFLNMIYNLEKKSFYNCKIDRNYDI